MSQIAMSRSISPLIAETFNLGPPIQALQSHEDYISWRRQVRHRLDRWGLTRMIDLDGLRPEIDEAGFVPFMLIEQALLQWLRASTSHVILAQVDLILFEPAIPATFMKVVEGIVCDVSVSEASQVWRSTIDLGRLLAGPQDGSSLEGFVSNLRDRVQLCNMLNFPITPIQAVYILFDGIQCFGREAEELIAAVEGPLLLQRSTTITEAEFHAICDQVEQLGEGQTPEAWVPDMDAIVLSPDGASPQDPPTITSLPLTPDTTLTELLARGCDIEPAFSMELIKAVGAEYGIASP